MNKHTPGPWVIDWNVSRLDVFSADAATLVATIRRSTLSDWIDDTAKSNARLIAAAPDLLDALTCLLRDIVAVDAVGDYGLELQPAMYQAHKAIAKATGVLS